MREKKKHGKHHMREDQISRLEVDKCSTVEKIPSNDERRQFLELGETWWWESNRQLPIDIFLHYEMKQFHKCLRTFVMKDIEVLFGPMTSLQNLLRKRIKRRGVQLVIKPKD